MLSKISLPGHPSQSPIFPHLTGWKPIFVPKGYSNKKSRPMDGRHFYCIKVIYYLYTANEKVDPDLESGWLSDVAEAFLEDSLVEVIFSDWLIFTACKTTMVRISTANTIRVDVFLPFFMVRLDLQVSLGFD